jgi:hypothetical protein
MTPNPAKICNTRVHFHQGKWYTKNIHIFRLKFFFIMLCSYLSVAQDSNLPLQLSAAEDHALMMQQLGIAAIRPGFSGNEQAPNAANYNEALANPCPELPQLLRLKSGVPVADQQTWWQHRRPEIIADFEQEVYGKVPENVPEVQWETKISDREFVNHVPVLARLIEGKVKHSGNPKLDVTLKMMLVLPRNVTGPVPVLMMFTGRGLAFPAPTQPGLEEIEKLNSVLKQVLIARDSSLQDIFDRYPAYQMVNRLPGPDFFSPPKPEEEQTPQEKLLSAGWGYCLIDTRSIQEDNGAGLTRGIIGLCNQGQPRKPSDWGALRAWAWAASRGLDFLEKDTLVDAKRIGIEGVSRYGKAALVAMAFEPRFAVGLIGSSGKGGTTLHRRFFGEAVENLAGPGEYHWMAGNYIKYAAEAGTFGRMTGCDLPVDSHQLLALCAPRPVFVSYGIPEAGDAKWLDQLGSYQATLAAGQVYQLLGAKDLGKGHNYQDAVLPPVLEGLLAGQLAWRQHDGGHTDGPNITHFISWANKMLMKNAVR